MKEKALKVANILALALVTLILATMQTSLWFQVFGYFPPPALWVPSLIFVAIYRNTIESILVTYLIALILSTMTSMPDSILLISCLMLTVSARSFKRRIFWSGTSYIMMISGFGALIFHIYQWVVSMLIEDRAWVMPELSDWLIEALFTPLIAPALFRLYHWLDKMTYRDQLVETGADLI